jgi:hypothetical protein
MTQKPTEPPFPARRTQVGKDAAGDQDDDDSLCPKRGDLAWVAITALAESNHRSSISFAITAWPKERPPSLGGTR